MRNFFTDPYVISFCLPDDKGELILTSNHVPLSHERHLEQEADNLSLVYFEYQHGNCAWSRGKPRMVEWGTERGTKKLFHCPYCRTSLDLPSNIETLGDLKKHLLKLGCRMEIIRP